MSLLRFLIVLSSLLSVLVFQDSKVQASITDLGDGRGTIETYVNGPTGSETGVLNVKVHNIDASTLVTGFYFRIGPAPTPTEPLKVKGFVDVYALRATDGTHYMPSVGISYPAPGYDLLMTQAADSRRPPNGPPTFGSHLDLDLELLDGTIDFVDFRLKENTPPNPEMAVQVAYEWSFTATSAIPISFRTVIYGEGEVGPGIIPEPTCLGSIGLVACALLRRSQNKN